MTCQPGSKQRSRLLSVDDRRGEGERDGTVLIRKGSSPVVSAAGQLSGVPDAVAEVLVVVVVVAAAVVAVAVTATVADELLLVVFVLRDDAVGAVPTSVAPPPPPPSSGSIDDREASPSACIHRARSAAEVAPSMTSFPFPFPSPLTASSVARITTKGKIKRRLSIKRNPRHRTDALTSTDPCPCACLPLGRARADGVADDRHDNRGPSRVNHLTFQL